jgi:hypothetical protein
MISPEDFLDNVLSNRYHIIKFLDKIEKSVLEREANDERYERRLTHARSGFELSRVIYPATGATATTRLPARQR